VSTNSDGRVDGPLLAGPDLAAKGVYELVFHAGDYLRGAGETLPEPAFLDVIPIRFGIADTECALPCAAADLGLWLFHLSRQLTMARSSQAGAPCVRQSGRSKKGLAWMGLPEKAKAAWQYIRAHATYKRVPERAAADKQLAGW
jgi:hypothetical protein